MSSIANSKAIFEANSKTNSKTVAQQAASKCATHMHIQNLKHRRRSRLNQSNAIKSLISAKTCSVAATGHAPPPSPLHAQPQNPQINKKP